jgi:putative ABC transport system permease protein
MHSAIEPLVLFPGGWGNRLLIKISGKDLPSTIAFLETKMKALAPQRPFEYRFMSDEYNKLYKSELRIGNVFSIFSGIAILLACLGLFGLSAYAAQQRIKEIGVRKVLGASVTNIVLLLAANFIKLIALAFVIAAPVAWYVMNKWLQDFAYRVNIGWWVFAIAALLVVVVAFITISTQSIKAAIANPVKSLRTE